jgi:Tol biopolymer transport system component
VLSPKLKVLLASALIALLLLSSGATLLPEKNAWAAYPGINGKIAFRRDTDYSLGSASSEIFVMNADGSDQTRLTFNDGIDWYPTWSPDGSKIAWTAGSIFESPDIFVMNADGSEVTQVTHNPYANDWPTWSPDGSRIAFVCGLPAGDGRTRDRICSIGADGSNQVQLDLEMTLDYEDAYPNWSPDGSKIAFTSNRPGLPGDHPEIFVMNADGTGVIQLTETDETTANYEPSFSPDGTKIAFAAIGNHYAVTSWQIFVMNVDGTGITQLTDNSYDNYEPYWSPDGSKIAFTSTRDGDPDIFVMNAFDGTGQTQLTFNSLDDSESDWQPAVETSTGSGTAYFCVDRATLFEFFATSEESLPMAGKPSLIFPHGFFEFHLSSLLAGSSVTVTIRLPQVVPVGTQYWKYGPTPLDPASHWYQIPIGDDDGDDLITITLTDGGIGDDDCIANGVIVDTGGPGIRRSEPEQVSDLASAIVGASDHSTYFVYPDYQGVKLAGVTYAWLSDWTATGFMLGMCSNIQYETTDTNPNIIDTGSGAITIQDGSFVLFGGPLVNAPVHYYEANRIAPLYYQNDDGTLYWYRADGTRIDATALQGPQKSSHDMFVVESFIDSNGNHIFIVYGYGWKGTFGAGKFLKFVMYPNIASYTSSYYVFQWIDGNGDGFVDLNEISTTPVAQG